MKRIIWTGLFAVCMLSACQQDETPGTGSLQVNLTDGADTRALPAFSDEMTGQFGVTVYNQADAKTVFQGTCAELNASSLLLKPGDHSVRALFGTNPALALDEPYYVSDPATVTIVSGKTKTVSLVCRVGNALAAFELTNQDKLEKVIKDYAIVTTVGDASVEWRPGDSANPYFQAGSAVTFYLKGTWLENNQPYSRKLAEIASAEAAHLYKYRFAVDTSNMTGLTLDITVDASVEEVGVSETLPQNWLPAPKIAASGFDALCLMTYTETADNVAATIAYTALRPVEEVELTLNYADPRLTGLNGTYLLSSLTEEQRTALQEADIELPAVDGLQKAGSLVFNTRDYLTLDGGVDASNRISVRVKANDRWSDTSTYEIQTIRPLFGLTVLPGNVWTKEFSASPLSQSDLTSDGNVSRFTDITYEYSTDGGNTWLPCTGVRSAGLTPNTTYYARAKYRGQIAGSAVAVKTYPLTALTNGGLESWSQVSGKDGNAFSNYGARFEFDGWATINQQTCDYCPWTAYNYNTRSGTRPVSDTPSGSGTAAWIATIGWGYGGTSGNPKHRTPSELFLGSLTDVDTGNDTATKNYGIDYGSHPTGVQFTYKYTPYDGDHSDIFVQVLNGDQVIGSGTLQQSNAVGSYTTHVMQVDYDANLLHLAPNRLILVFRSGVNASTTKQGINNVEQVGSQLFVDDISLVYDK